MIKQQLRYFLNLQNPISLSKKQVKKHSIYLLCNKLLPPLKQPEHQSPLLKEIKFKIGFASLRPSNLVYFHIPRVTKKGYLCLLKMSRSFRGKSTTQNNNRPHPQEKIIKVIKHY